MSEKDISDPNLWREQAARLADVWANLPNEERAWIRVRVEAIARLQERMHQLFAEADGDAHCARCRGACCDRGKYHLTLSNLLGCLAAGRPLPTLDFGASCPLLGEGGCLLPVAMRPFNCVTFVCDSIEEAMGPEAANLFYVAEKTLRGLYRQMEERYAGAGARGFLLAAARLQGASPLARLDRDGACTALGVRPD